MMKINKIFKKIKLLFLKFNIIILLYFRKEKKMNLIKKPKENLRKKYEFFNKKIVYNHLL
jgi:hypothetical protein